ncbi:bifunctional 3,4-dihydroxy-2-butanone-4-phosphate synthase/GTP cyclohydrolase II [Amycolatopsis sp. TRM77291]
MTGRSSAEAVERAVSTLAGGGLVVVIDDADRENEGDLVAVAEFVTDEQMAFLVRHTTGIVCVPMPGERCDELGLPQMVADNTDTHGTAFTVSVDHIATGTGVSAADRASSVRALADLRTTPEQLRRPGHVFPLRARPGGVLTRAGHTEAAVDLSKLAGGRGIAVIGELVAPDGSMLRADSLSAFAAEHGLPMMTVADLIRYRRTTERLVEHVATATLPTRFGEFRVHGYRSSLDGSEHLAIALGDVAAAGNTPAGVLTRVHSECLTGDVLGSLRCDCGTQLDQALQAIQAEGSGVLVYLRGHEGRGIGLAHKIRAYSLQEQGLDTVDANVAQGLPVDSRTYDIGAQILIQLGVRRLRLITNNPAKYEGLDSYGLEIVGRVALPTVPTAENVSYLHTKKERLGHLLDIRRSS